MDFVPPPDDFSLEAEIKRLLGIDAIEQTQGEEKPEKFIDYDDASKRFKCLKCTATFAGKGNCRDHVNTVHFGMRFKCDSCPKTYRSLSYLYEHKKVHSKVAKIPI